MLGFINVYKPSGITSSKVVTSLKKKFNLDKIGHMGTLDPMAEGVLPIAVGKATRLFDYFLEKKKTYIATFTFGSLTDTLDSTGKIINSSDFIPTEKEIKKALKFFIGKQNQTPPNFSAKSINGVRAYALARKNIDFIIPPKEIEIFKYNLIKKLDNKTYMFEIECSSGTYIRSLARDLGERLNTFAIMSALIRVKSGFFTLKNSVTMDKLLKADSLINFVLPIDKVFSKFNKYNLDKKRIDDILNGRLVKLDKPFELLTFICENGKIIGVANTNSNTLQLKTYLKD